jgi:hypothetical protein
MWGTYSEGAATVGHVSSGAVEECDASSGGLSLRNEKGQLSTSATPLDILVYDDQSPRSHVGLKG